MAWAIIPCEGNAELAEFSGKFEEGSGFSMGKPIRWKNPKGAISRGVVSSLKAWDQEPFKVMQHIFDKYIEIDRIYAESSNGCDTEWYTRSDIR